MTICLRVVLASFAAHACLLAACNHDLPFPDPPDGPPGDCHVVPVRGACTPGGWCYQKPMPLGQLLLTAWTDGTDNLWGGGFSGSIVHWDGSALTGQFVGDRTFVQIGGSANDLWAVALESDIVYGASPLIYRFRGESWRREDNVPPDLVWPIWITSSTDIWAASAGGTSLRHWDGSGWSSVPSEFKGTLLQLWSASPGDLWAAVDNNRVSTTVFRRAASQWVALVNLDDLFSDSVAGFAGSSPSDVWLVTFHGRLLHWNGDSWAEHAIPDSVPERTYVNGILRPTPQDLWISAIVFPAGAERETQSLLHLSGTTWSRHDDFPGHPIVQSFAASGEDNLWAVGESGAVFRYVDRAFCLLTRGVELRADVNINSLSALEAVCATGPSDAWAGGNNGAPIETPLLLHWDGREWATQSPGVEKTIQRLWAAGPGDIWIVADRQVGHWSGGGWAINTMPAHAPFALWGSSASDLWLGGTDGALFHNDGAGWSGMPTAVLGTDDVAEIAGSGSSDVWALTRPKAEGSRILHFDGNAWQEKFRTSTRLYSATATSPADAWATGEQVILHWDGKSWSPHSRAGELAVNGFGPIWARIPSEVWANATTAARTETLLHWDGLGWAATGSLPVGPVTALTGSASDVWAVSERGGTILHRAQ